MRTTLVLAAIAALAFASAADAKSCKDAAGKFVKCPAPAAAAAKPALAAKAAPCKDAKGKFVKCGTTTAAAKPSVAATASKPAPAAAPGKVASTSGSPHCMKGKPCGKSCIAMDKVCHK